MQVWVVYANEFGDPETAIGVFSSEANARAAIERYEERNRLAWQPPITRAQFSVHYAVAGPFELDSEENFPYAQDVA